MLSRRSMFGVSAAVVAASVPFAVNAMPAPLSADEATAYAQRESEAINTLVARLNGGNYPESVWEAWEERDTHFLKWAENLPIGPAYAKAKAIAFSTIYARNGGLDEFLDNNPTTDSRLALQVIKSVLGGLN